MWGGLAFSFLPHLPLSAIWPPIGRVSPRRATFFLASPRKKATPAAVAPTGLPSFRPRRTGSSQTRGYAPQTCEALIRPSQPPLGTTEGAVSITRIKHLAARVAALENQHRLTSPQPYPGVSEADHAFSPSGFAFLPICPAEQRSPGRGLPAQLSEPAGRVLRRPHGASSAGQSAKGRPGERGSPSLLTFLATQESKSPAGASPGQRGVG